MTIRKKSSSTSGHRGTELACGKDGVKPRKSVKKQDAPALAAPVPNERLPARKESLADNLELRAAAQRSYLDPMEVQQWMTNSGLELDPLSEASPYGLYNAGPDAVVAAFSQDVPGSLSFMQSVPSPISLQDSAFLPAPGTLPGNYDAAGEPILASGVNQSFDFAQGLDINHVQSMGEQYHNTWSYPTPVDDSFLLSNQTFVPSADLIDEPGLGPEWISEPFQAGADIFPGTVGCDPQPMAWPLVPVVDSSAASSYSRNSLLGYLPNSPISPDVQEDAAQRACMDDTIGLYPTLSLGEALPFSCPMDGADLPTSMRFVRVFNRAFML
jgi:hypothetical protein